MDSKLTQVFTVAVAVALTVTACDSSNPGNAPDADTATIYDADPAGWVSLIEGDWSLPAGSGDSYYCVRKTMTEDTYVKAFQAIIPLGTHHTVLTIGAPSGADGITPCGAGTNASSQIYGSGVGTNSIVFPPGVAVKIPAGQQLLLNLHLFNVSDSVLTGTSGTRIQTMAVSDVVHEAESILMGKTFGLNVQPGESTQTGTCTMTRDVTIFAMQPHMHQLGSHMQVIANSTIDGTTTIWDAPYSFDEQIASLVGPVEMAAGNTVTVTCTYNNTTGEPVGFGDSSNDEMCFAGVYRYPKQGNAGLVCFN